VVATARLSAVAENAAAKRVDGPPLEGESRERVRKERSLVVWSGGGRPTVPVIGVNGVVVFFVCFLWFFYGFFIVCCLLFIVYCLLFIVIVIVLI
jgi:hypothetical protein